MPVSPSPIADLRGLVRTFPSALLGYSGGVDSAFLAVVLRQELGRSRMLAAIGRSASYPEAQWRSARDVADRFDVPVLEVDTHELEDPNYLANPTNRCFYCKSELWSRLVPLARARGFAVVCDGTNADDLSEGEHRPGRAAGEQAGVRSPLAEAGLTKAAIRAASRELGLRGDLRVRHRGGAARIEVEPAWISWAEQRLEAIAARLTDLGFAHVELDPRGYRRGSLLESSSP